MPFGALGGIFVWPINLLYGRYANYPLFCFGGEAEIIKKTKKRRKKGRKCEKIEKSAGIIAFF